MRTNYRWVRDWPSVVAGAVMVDNWGRGPTSVSGGSPLSGEGVYQASDNAISQRSLKSRFVTGKHAYPWGWLPCVSGSGAFYNAFFMDVTAVGRSVFYPCTPRCCQRFDYQP